MEYNIRGVSIDDFGGNSSKAGSKDQSCSPEMKEKEAVVEGNGGQVNEETTRGKMVHQSSVLANLVEDINLLSPQPNQGRTISQVFGC